VTPIGRFQQVGDFVFDCTSCHLWRAGKPIEHFGANEGKLLKFLIEHHDTNYTNEKIESFIWDSKGHKQVDRRLHTTVSNLRQFFEPEADEYISRNKTPVRLIKTPRSKPHCYRPDLPDEQPRLTPRDPQDEPPAQRLWNEATDHEHNLALHDFEWAWVTPFRVPLRIKDFHLTYRADSPPYEKLMPPLASKGLEWWRGDQIKKGKATRTARLEAEPMGLQVRLVGMRFAHELGQRHHIDLAPAKFLHYIAIQQNLWAEELHELRQRVFENAIRAINDEVPLMLPCTFAIHMAAISSDQKALLRRRDKTPIYPLAWEAGPGELMHGPEYTKAEILHHGRTDEDFPHFNEQGEPDFSLYLRNTVKEELSYKNAKDDDFLIYGMAVEWRTLAPKLIVVYQSDVLIDVLVEGAKRSPERPRAVSSIDLSVDGITTSFTNGQYPTWGPTSKLALLLALVQRDGENQVKEVQARMDELDPQNAA
jgi:hypothetical protein